MADKKKEYIWKVPDREQIKIAVHLKKAIRIGQDSAGDKRIYILKGGNKAAKRETAAAIVYGWQNRQAAFFDEEPSSENEICPENPEESSSKIDEELDRLWSPLFNENAAENSAGTGADDLLARIYGEKITEGKNSCYNSANKTEKIKLLKEKMWISIDPNTEADEVCYSAYSCNTLDGDPADGYLIEGEISTKRNPDVLEKIKEKKGALPLFVCLDGLTEKSIRRLQFEDNALLVQVQEADMNYYKSLFQIDLQENGEKLGKEVDIENVIHSIKEFRADCFREEDFRVAIEKASQKATKEKRTELILSDFNLFGSEYVDPERSLQSLIGLNKVKKKVLRLAALSAYNMKRKGLQYDCNPCHMAFAGDPGTGKSETAKIYARILAKYGMSNGTFINANKSDYVGRYIGFTSKMVKELFAQARGGVIFFEECGCLLTEDAYTKEALTEIVRFMEQYRDVTCIFASYENNIRELLEKDAGLRSRITEIIVFENYSNEELYQILELFCGKENYILEDSREVFYEYVNREKRNHSDSYGNGRLSRNVFEKIKEVLAEEVIKSGRNPAEVEKIKKANVIRAIEELNENIANDSREIGFIAVK